MSDETIADDVNLEYTQNLRKKLVDQFAADGEFPNDPKMVQILLGALKDYDKVTLTVKRIKSDKETSDADRQAMERFHKLSSMMGSQDVFQRDESDSLAQDNVGGPVDFNPDEIPVQELEEGELAQGVESIDYNDFMSEQEQKHKASFTN